MSTDGRKTKTEPELLMFTVRRLESHTGLTGAGQAFADDGFQELKITGQNGSRRLC